MAQKQNGIENSSFFHMAGAEVAATVKNCREEFATAQAELLDTLQETSRYWLDRIQIEAQFASEIPSKLTAARSVPDIMTACQIWGDQRLKIMAEDTKHLFDDTQKFMQVGVHHLANGRRSAISSVRA